MFDWPIIAVRWGLFASLGLLLGIPLFDLYARRLPDRDKLASRLGLLLLGWGALGLSLFGFVVLIAGMTGTPLTSVDPQLAQSIILDTPVGSAFIVRSTSLGLVLATLLAARKPSTLVLVTISTLSTVALGSLAWNGHGGAGEGWAAWPHLIADIIHLLAAGAWLGAIACLLFLVMRRSASVADLTLAQACLRDFAPVGTLIVALLILTGLINGVVILGEKAFEPGLGSTYIVLLAAKLALFAAMLALAALHRFRFVPAVEAAHPASISHALGPLRVSLALELACAMIIFGLVAWLGTLEPAL